MNLFAVDVDYRNEHAYAAGILFHAWTDPAPSQIYKAKISNVEEYQSGQFYKRELPCIVRLVVQLDGLPDCIVVDGHVFLDENNRPGLGYHLYQSLEETVAFKGEARSFSNKGKHLNQ